MKKPKPVYSERWRNHAKIEVFFHEQKLTGYDESDRVELVVTTEDGATPSLVMNVEDAIGIIRGLTVGIQCCIQRGIPVVSVGRKR